LRSGSCMRLPYKVFCIMLLLKIGHLCLRLIKEKGLHSTNAVGSLDPSRAV